MFGVVFAQQCRAPIGEAFKLYSKIMENIEDVR